RSTTRAAGRRNHFAGPKHGPAGRARGFLAPGQRSGGSCRPGGSCASIRPAAAVAPAQETSHVDAPYVEIPHSRVRQVVAGRLGESKRTIPHFYLETSCRVDALLRVRAEVAGQRDGGLK